jgi:predicted O-methyltransferase YrrM
MVLTGTPDELIAIVAMDCPEIYDVLERVRDRVPFIKREILRHEAAVLYMLARDYNRASAKFLEIGTAWGYSAAIMAEAAPLAKIVTLNQPKPSEYERAIVHLAPYENVTALMECSWDYLKKHGEPYLDFVFVDGDHDQVERDLPWWDLLLPGGLMLFHDYSPDGAGRPCQQVVDVVDRFSGELEPDILVVDNRRIGMVGFYRADNGNAAHINKER